MAGLLMLLLRWRQGKELELGFELEEAHFIFINIIIGRKKKKKNIIILYYIFSLWNFCWSSNGSSVSLESFCCALFNCASVE